MKKIALTVIILTASMCFYQDDDRYQLIFYHGAYPILLVDTETGHVFFVNK